MASLAPTPQDVQPKRSVEPRTARSVAVSFLAAVLIFTLLSVASDVSALGASLSQYRFRAVGAALSLVAGNYLLRFVRWQYYLRTLGIAVRAPLSALVFLSGFVMSVTPGKLGEVLKALLLREHCGAEVARTAPIVLAERLMDLVALVLLIAVSSAGLPYGSLITAAGGLVVSALLLLVSVRPLAQWCFGTMEHWPLVGALVPSLREAHHTLGLLLAPRPLMTGSILALGGWALEGAAAYQIVGGFEDARAPFAAVTFCYAASTLGGALAMLPGGLGVTEVGLSGLLQVVSKTMTAPTAAAATIMIRLATLWFGVAIGAFSLLLLRTVMRRRTP